MKKTMNRSLLYGFLVITVLNAPAFAAPIPAHPSRLAYDTLRWTVPLGDPYRMVLKNGMRAYVAVDSQLPLIKMTVYIHYGTLLDPKGREGESTLMTTLMRTGGTANFPADTLDALIDRFAMDISLKSSEDLLQVSASFLSEYTDTALSFLREIIFFPRFDEKKLEKEKKIYIDGVRHRFDNPGPTLDIAYQKVMYQATAASTMATENSIKKIARANLADLHRKILAPGAMICAIAGMFDRGQMIARLEKTFSSTARSRVAPFPGIQAKPAVRCLVVHKPISQVYVRFGIPVFKRPHPDYYPVSVANMILGGGGFTSRLGTVVRSDAGLTYSIYSSAESNYTYPGTWYVEFFTKNESFPRAVTLALSVIDSLRKSGVTDKELANAKASLIDEMPSRFRTPYDIVSTYAWNEYFGRPADIFKVYADSIRVISRDAVQRVMKTWLDPAAFTFTVVGDTAALAKYHTDGAYDFNTIIPRKTIAQDSIPALP
jgi:zinc protease